MATSNTARVALNTLRNAPGAVKKAIREGRGRSSRRPKTAGRGHKGSGQHASKHLQWFAGGQTPIFRTRPKHGVSNSNQVSYEPLNLTKLAQFVERGKLDIDNVIDLKTLQESGAVGKITHGVKLLATGADQFNLAVELEVTQASKKAIQAVEDAGGSIRCVYRNRLGLRAHLKPEKFDVLPRPAAPPRKLQAWYTDPNNRGQLLPEQRLRYRVPGTPPPTAPSDKKQAQPDPLPSESA
eukprot:m.16949 g.16949  ORF g.16949 m.16949 type:complete len:239 (-) comp5358_c0_seq1:225-941(-)